MKDADIALYRAKEQRRSQAVVYTSAARQTMEHRVSIAHDVREGLAAQQFTFPTISRESRLQYDRRIVGFEALARWKHPTKGLLAPLLLVRCSLSRPFRSRSASQMIRQVAADVRSWLDQGLECGRVAVNLSSADISDPGLRRQDHAAFWKMRVSPRRISRLK